MALECALKAQGFESGSCLTFGKKIKGPACALTIKWQNGVPYRLIKSAHLSRPEHYFSIYQSGCNMSCKKCHSWEFSQYANGRWLSPKDIKQLAEEYSGIVNYWEPKERATSFHALELCKGCGSCVKQEWFYVVENGIPQIRYTFKETERRSLFCPKKIKPSQVILSPQGLGPARNIIAFTGGDVMCRTEFYTQSTELIKSLEKNLWVLLETNGYGLTPKNLDLYKASGVDSFWLDIKAWDEATHKALTGVSNRWIIRLPEEILKRGFTLEVLSLFIPGWVEEDQISKIAKHLSSVDPEIPFTVLAFFPENELRDVSSPTIEQMISAYQASKEAGLKNVRMGNIGVFAKTEDEIERLLKLAPDCL